MRGELFDGRGFIKTATSAQQSGDKGSKSARDFDLDVKLATVTGYNVEALRGVELRLSRRNGQVRQFGMVAKLGTNASLRAICAPIRAAGRSSIWNRTTPARCCASPTCIRVSTAGRCGSRWIRRPPISGRRKA